MARKPWSSAVHTKAAVRSFFHAVPYSRRGTHTPLEDVSCCTGEMRFVMLMESAIVIEQ